jgi:hypothetical protein
VGEEQKQASGQGTGVGGTEEAPGHPSPRSHHAERGPKPTLPQPPPQVPRLCVFPSVAIAGPSLAGDGLETQHPVAPSRAQGRSRPGDQLERAEQAGVEVDRREAGPILDQLHLEDALPAEHPDQVLHPSLQAGRRRDRLRERDRAALRRPGASVAAHSVCEQATIGRHPGKRDDVSAKTSLYQGVSAILGPQGLERGIALDHHARPLHGAAIHGAHGARRFQHDGISEPASDGSRLGLVRAHLGFRCAEARLDCGIPESPLADAPLHDLRRRQAELDEPLESLTMPRDGEQGSVAARHQQLVARRPGNVPELLDETSLILPGVAGHEAPVAGPRPVRGGGAAARDRVDPIAGSAQAPAGRQRRTVLSIRQ